MTAHEELGANKALVQRYFDERWNRKNPDICDELLDPRLVERAKDFGPLTIHAALADIEFTLLDLVAEGDQVVIGGSQAHVGGIHGRRGDRQAHQLPRDGLAAGRGGQSCGGRVLRRITSRSSSSSERTRRPCASTSLVNAQPLAFVQVVTDLLESVRVEANLAT